MPAAARSSEHLSVFDITDKSDRKKRHEVASKRRIMVHQTDGSGSDSPMAWRSTNAHWGVLNNAGLVQIHPLDTHVQGSYPDTIAIEVGGKFPAFLTPDPKDRAAISFNKKHKKRLNEAQTWGIEEAIRRSLGFILQDPSAKASDVTLLAHRQTYASRIYDPGQEIYQVAAREARRLGMTVPYNYKKDSGTPIPSAWKISGMVGARPHKSLRPIVRVTDNYAETRAKIAKEKLALLDIVREIKALKQTKDPGHGLKIAAYAREFPGRALNLKNLVKDAARQLKILSTLTQNPLKHYQGSLDRAIAQRQRNDPGELLAAYQNLKQGPSLNIDLKDLPDKVGAVDPNNGPAESPSSSGSAPLLWITLALILRKPITLLLLRASK